MGASIRTRKMLTSCQRKPCLLSINLHSMRTAQLNFHPRCPPPYLHYWKLAAGFRRDRHSCYSSVPTKRSNIKLDCCLTLPWLSKAIDHNRVAIRQDGIDSDWPENAMWSVDSPEDSEASESSPASQDTENREWKSCAYTSSECLGSRLRLGG